MKDLEFFREAIDECDKEIVKALEKRFDAVKGVIAYKKKHDIAILQPNREDQVLEKVESYQDSNEYSEEIKSIYLYIMEKSKEIQKKN